jgi:oxygen-independent coproporphyrinogen III oxidase
MPNLPLSLYLHIPFCRHICTYCAFNTYANMDDSIAPFVQALVNEINYIGTYTPNLDVHTVFFGGGTPSMLNMGHFEAIFEAIRHNFLLRADAEISLEANPNDLTAPYVRDLCQVGFNRLSIGMQSAKEAELQMYERQHDMAMMGRVMDDVRQAGFENVSLDLMFGNPQQSLSDWELSLNTALAFAPQHISLYGLEVKGGTVLKKQIQAGVLPKPSDDMAADMYDMATNRLAEAGFNQYEISNWSQPMYQARHNLQYWHNLPYLGFGAGAHGYANNTRTIAIRAPQRYIEALRTPHKERDYPRTPATSKATLIDKANELSETIMMGMRLTQEGVQRKAFHERFGMDVYALKRETIEKYVGLGMLDVTDEYIRLSQQGRLVSNVVIADLI